MDDEKMVWLQAQLTVQAYVQQVILSAIVASKPDRDLALRTIGAGFRQSLPFRMLAPPIEMRPNDDLRVQAAAIRIFDDFLAQVRAAAALVPAPAAAPDGASPPG